MCPPSHDPDLKGRRGEAGVIGKTWFVTVAAKYVATAAGATLPWVNIRSVSTLSLEILAKKTGKLFLCIVS